MNVNTITCHRVYNHGAALQAYALATFIKDNGHDVHIIDYRPDYLRGHYEWNVNNPRFDKPVLRWLYLVAKYPGWKKSLKRKAAFDAFDEKFIAPFVTKHCYMSADELKKCPPEADIYIAGSDQIWNTTFKNGLDSSFYLDFGNENVKRISYAASFATSALKYGTEDFVKSKLSNLDFISVREPSGLNILESFDLKGTLVCDPVFLLSRDTWSEKVASKDGVGDKYVLVYDFECNQEVRFVAERFAKAKSMKIYSIGPYPLDYADKNYINYGPDAFVGLVKSASCVISNSFHATAFAMIFRRNLFVVKRSDGLNTRMQDLLGRYGLIHRLVGGDASLDVLCEDIDYESVYVPLSKEIEDSKTWLLNNLK